MNCPKCKALMPEDALYCGICGSIFPGKYKDNSVRGFVAKGFEAFKRKPFMMSFSILILMMTPYLVNWLTVYAFTTLEIKPTIIGVNNINIFMGMLWILFANLIWAGFLYSVLKTVRGEKARIFDIFSGFGKLFSLLVIYAFTVAITMSIWIGFNTTIEIILQLHKPEFALFEPLKKLVLDFGFHIIAVIGLFFMSVPVLVIMDQKVNAFKAIVRSYSLTKGFKLSFILLSILLFVMNLFGILAVIVGIIISMSISVASIAAFYDQALNKNG